MRRHAVRELLGAARARWGATDASPAGAAVAEPLVDAPRDDGPVGAPGPTSLRCKAPWAALYLDPRGEVKVCCQNEWLRLGNVAERTLTEIWRGPELERLRSHVADDDLSLGCEMCAIAVERGAADSAYFNSYDALRLDPDHIEWPLQLDLALSNSCNLQCVMCNGELSSAIRIRREHRPPLESPYGEAFFDELDDFLPHLQAVTFLGGEPFLAKEALRVMERLVELGLTPKCSVTTNGTQWSPRVERLVQRLPMDIAISIDGTTAETLESIRVGAEHGVLVRNIEHFRRATEVAGGSVRFSSCLMLPNWHEFGALLAWADELDVDVFVNTVHHPPHLSFAHCPPERLAEVVAGLEAESVWRAPALARNRHVWDEQLRSVQGLLHHRLHDGALDVQEVPVELSARPGTSVAELVADEQQLVREVRHGGGATSVDLDRLVGSSLWETVRLLSSSLGELRSSEVHRDEQGTEQRRLRFVRDDTTTEVSATMVIRPDGGPTWRLGFRETATPTAPSPG